MAGTIAVRVGPNWGITPVSTPLAVLQAIQSGGDVLVDGHTATLTNSGGNWFVNGVPVASLFMVATGPNVAPTDTPAPTGPILSPLPVIRADPYQPTGFAPGTGPSGFEIPTPVTATGSLNLTPGTMIILAAAAYFLFFRRSS